MTKVFLILIISMWFFWVNLFNILSKINFSLKQLILIIAIVSLPLVLAHNSLSSDIFNYILNAKVVLVYGQDPHIFAPENTGDEWLRFMQNANGLAPYGYGWTGISLGLYKLGMGKFMLTWLVFKIFNYGGFLFLVFILGKILQIKKMRINILWWAICPWFLIEFIANSHNDIWMMIPILGAFYFLEKNKKLVKNNDFSLRIASDDNHKLAVDKEMSIDRRFYINIILIIVLTGLSISVKYVTVALIPAIVFMMIWPIYQSLIISKKNDSKIMRWMIDLLDWGEKYVYDLCALVLMLPLLTDRSWQFHPWYLIWAGVFMILSKNKWLKIAGGLLAITSTLRYLPYMKYMEYSDSILLAQRIITWSAIPILIIIFLIDFIINKQKDKNICEN